MTGILARRRQDVTSPATYSRPGLIALAAVPVALIVTWVVVEIGGQIASPGLHTSVDLRPLTLCLALTGLNAISYVAWFSRWNVLAHAQLAFSVVGYFIPVLALHNLRNLPSGIVNSYLEVIVGGFACALLGALLGGRLASAGDWRNGPMRARLQAAVASGYIERRVYLILWWSVAAVALTFLYIGFAPALTPDPLVAKYFRGAYGGRYQTVAPLYRFGTTAIALLMPLAAVFAWQRKSTRWRLVFAASVLVMLLGLLRGPTFVGLLLAIGVYFAVRRRHLILYFFLLFGFYFVGASLYQVLRIVGFGAFAGTNSTGSILQQAASGAPDVNDQVHFLQAWYSHPVLTAGRTFYGGLIPSNYKWNPSVFSLKILNPNQKISDIASGGLRLPAPIWGLASFGVVGVVFVSFGYGAVYAYLAAIMKQVVVTSSIIEAICWQVLYGAAVLVFPVFFRLSYLAVLELVIIGLLIFKRPKQPKQHKASAPQAARTQERALS